MAKIRRNDPCPCGSGIKYKRCCLQKENSRQTVSPASRLRISLLGEIEKIQDAAHNRKETVSELGVFIFCATSDGDAWLLETTENDAVQVADAGTSMPAPIEENPETIEINWSHTFSIRDRQLYLKSYEDRQETVVENMPVKRIRAAMKRIRKKYSAEQLRQVHVDPPPDAG